VLLVLRKLEPESGYSPQALYLCARARSQRNRTRFKKKTERERERVPVLLVLRIRKKVYWCVSTVSRTLNTLNDWYIDL